MSALDIVKQLSPEEVLDKIKARNLREYGLCKEELSGRIERVLGACGQAKRQPRVVAALHNADVDGVLLDLLKSEPEKVMEGILTAAYAIGAEKKILYIPEYAAGIAEQENIKKAATDYEVELCTAFLNKRACSGDLLLHIVTAYTLAEAMEGGSSEGSYVSVNGGKLQRIPEETKLEELADLTDAKAVRSGYRYILPRPDMTVAEADPENAVLQILTEKECIVAETEKRLTAYRKQSCGKCVFCREGLVQLQHMQKEITEGRGKTDYIELTKEIGEAMVYSTPCTVGQEASLAVLTALELFGAEYDAHIKKKKCSGGVCFSEQTVYIDPKLCSGCGDCMNVCPKNCIEGKANYIHMIDDIDCDKCGKCVEICEEGAVVKTAGKVPKLPNRLTKVGRFKKR